MGGFIPRSIVVKKLIDQLTEKLNNLDLRFIDRRSYNLGKDTSISSIIKVLENYGELIKYSNTCLLTVSDKLYLYTEMTQRDTFITINISTHCKTYEDCEQFWKDIEVSLNPYMKSITSCDVYWYSTMGKDLDNEVFTEVLDDVIHEESYPYIQQKFGKNLDKFIEEFLNGDEQVIIFMGPPGTGKTRLIRHIIKTVAEKKKTTLTEDEDMDFYSPRKTSSGCSIIYSMDSDVLTQDQIFKDFLKASHSFMVLEDMDFSLTARNKGNTVMYRLLGTSDGFLRNQTKKLIISTNIEEKYIDEALLRPGRCYAVVKARKLDHKEAEKLLERLTGGKGELNASQQYTLAEIYSLAKNRSIEARDSDIKKLGFET
jgi:SpoVK/Ycf46/Vps4 family AAA+-type ATPase